MLEFDEQPRLRPTKWLLIFGLVSIAAAALFLTLFHEAGGTQAKRTPAPVATLNRAELTLAGDKIDDAVAAPIAQTSGETSRSDRTRLALPLPRPNRSMPTDEKVVAKTSRQSTPVPVPIIKAEKKAVSSTVQPTATAKTSSPLIVETPDATLSDAAANMIRSSLALPAKKFVAPTTAKPEPSSTNRIEFEIARGDTLDELFADNNLSRAHLAQILRLDDARKHLQLLRPGDKLSVDHDNGKVIHLSRALDEERTLEIRRDDDGRYSTDVSINPVEIRTAHARGVIKSSLFLAAQDIGISDTLIMNLAGIFAWDVDFILDIRSGDSFTLIYEERWQDGEKLSNGEILAAEFNNSGKSFRAVRFEDPDGNAGYFTPEGLSVKKAFLRAPIAISPRVTSSFNPRRMHPVKKRVLPHKGVDYSAPTGTAIKAAGDGKVIFRGRKGGYGNTIILQHGGNITTLYAHLSKFHNRARNGKRVKQGQIIGYSGATGTVTAAHLHYEYRVGGVHRNPRTVKLPKAQPVASQYREQFASATAPLLQQLEVVDRTLRVATGDTVAE